MVIPAAGACCGLAAGYFNGFKAFMNKKPPKDVMWESIIWEDVEVEKMKSQESRETIQEVQELEEEQEPDLHFFLGGDDLLSQLLEEWSFNNGALEEWRNLRRT